MYKEMFLTDINFVPVHAVGGVCVVRGKILIVSVRGKKSKSLNFI
jgi:hypothetical protein